MGPAIAIAVLGMAVVFAVLAAIWLAMVILARLPSKEKRQEAVENLEKEDAPASFSNPDAPEEQVVAVVAAAMVLAQQGSRGQPATSRPLSPWRAVVRSGDISIRERG